MPTLIITARKIERAQLQKHSIIAMETSVSISEMTLILLPELNVIGFKKKKTRLKNLNLIDCCLYSFRIHRSSFFIAYGERRIYLSRYILQIYSMDACIYLSFRLLEREKKSSTPYYIHILIIHPSQKTEKNSFFSYH